MDVVLGVGGDVEVDDVADVRDVDAAREHVGGHEHVHLAVAELLEGALALALAAVAVDGSARDAGAPQATAAGVGAVLGACEYDDAACALALEHLCEQGVLGLERDGQRVLVDGLGDRPLAGDLHRSGVPHQVLDAADRPLVQRRGEQERLALCGSLGDDLSHSGQKAHVEHAVGLVEDQDLDLAQACLALVDEVHKAARRRHEDVAAALEGGLLRLVADAAHDGEARVARALPDDVTDVGDLLGELAGRRDHEHAGPVPAPRVAEAAHRGKQEGRRLARAGLRRGQKVAALQGQGDGRRLDGGGLGVSERVDGAQDLFGEAEVGEGRALLIHGIALGHAVPYVREPGPSRMCPGRAALGVQK